MSKSRDAYFAWYKSGGAEQNKKKRAERHQRRVDRKKRKMANRLAK